MVNEVKSISSRTNELTVQANGNGMVVSEQKQGQDVSRSPVELKQPLLKSNYAKPNGRDIDGISESVS